VTVTSVCRCRSLPAKGCSAVVIRSWRTPSGRPPASRLFGRKQLRRCLWLEEARHFSFVMPEPVQIEPVILTQKTAVISGGPGTGKTTTVAKLLAALIRLSEGTQHEAHLFGRKQLRRCLWLEEARHFSFVMPEPVQIAR
jgi:hypothetical protein